MIIKQAAVYIFLGFLPVAVNFILAPVYAKFLLPEAYAIIGIATLFQTFLTFFLTLSLDGAFARLYFDYEKKGVLKNALLSSIIISITAVSILNFFLLWIFGDFLLSRFLENETFNFSDYGVWVYLTTFANSLFLLFVPLFRNEGNIKKFAIATLGFFLLPIIGTLIGLIYLDEGAYGAIVGRAIGSATVIAVLLLHYFSRNKLLFKRKFLVRSLKYSLPLVPYQIMFAAFSSVDRIILERNFQPHDFGVYNFAVMVAGVIPVFLNALSNATTPVIVRELSLTRNYTLVRHYNLATILVSVLVICCCVAAVVPAMRMFINTEYRDCYPYIGSIFLSFIPYVHYQNASIPLFFHGKTRAFPFISFFALIAGIAFIYLLLPALGIWAICLSLYVIRIVQLLAAFFFLYINRYHNLDYIKQREPILLSILVIAFYNLLFYLNFPENYLSFDMMNLLPLLVFILGTFLFYRKRLLNYFSLFLKFSGSLIK